MHFLRLAGFLIVLLWFLIVQIASASEKQGIVQAKVGEQQVFWGPNFHQLNYFPDEPISVLSTTPFRCLMVSGNATIMMEGQTPESAIPVRTVLTPGGPNDFDNGYAGITSVYPDTKSKTLLAFYHAEDHVGMPRVSYNNDVHGAYWSIGLAVSIDNGNTFQKRVQILRSKVSKQKVTKEHQGIGDVCVIPDGSKQWLYAYYTDLTRRQDDQRAKIALARSRSTQSARPGTWFKYHQGEFKQKGLGGDETAVVNPPADFESEVFAPHVSYIAEWKKYVMVCNVLAYREFENQTAKKSGIYYCYSEDGIHWTTPELLVSGLPVPLQDKEYLAHPSVFIVSVEGKKAEGWLLYCHSSRWGKPEDNRIPHHLARRPMTLTYSE